MANSSRNPWKGGLRPALLTFAAALFALYALSVAWRNNAHAAGFDFYIYYVNAQLPSRADVENIYASETQDRIGEEYFARAQTSGSEVFKYDATRRRRLDNVSSPFLYTTLRWVSRDYERALVEDRVLILACFILGVILIARRVTLPWWATLTLLGALLLWYRGFEADLRVGNVNSMQLAVLATALWSPPAIAGALMGMLLAFKPNLMFVPLLLVFSPQWRKYIAGGLAGVAIAIAAASINYGTPRVWLQWITAANQFWHRIPTALERNVTPALPLFEKFGTWPSYVIAIALIALVIRKRGDEVTLAGLGILVYLMSATVVWLHYMVLVIPIAIALMRGRTAIIAILALALIAEVPVEWITKTAVYPHDWITIAPALVILFAAGAWRLRDERHRARAAA